MSEGFWSGAITAALIVGAVYYFNKPETPPENAAVGTYQIVDTEGGDYLLNTQTGETWRHVVMFSEYKPNEFLSSFWSTEQKYNDDSSEVQHTNIVKDLDKQIYGPKPKQP